MACVGSGTFVAGIVVGLAVLMSGGVDLASLLRGSQCAYGTLMVSPLPTFAAAVASTGIDFVFIDTEHVPLDRGELERMCFAYKQLGLPPLVRIPRADAVLARAVIDAGACGVVASYMETVAEVHELRKGVKLKPLQGELLRTAMEAPEKFARSHARTKAYIEARQSSCALVVNVESQAAIDNLEAILAVPGVDAVLVGPHDLSCSLGVPEDFESPVFQKALETIFAKARKANVGAGIHMGMPPTTAGMTPDMATRWITEYGCNVYIHAADVNLFATQLKRDLAQIKHTAGGLDTNGSRHKRPRDEVAAPII